MKALRVLAVVLVCSSLGACATTGSPFSGRTSDSPARKVVAKMASIAPLDKALVCMRPALRGKRVAVTAWVNGTNKGNAVADAGTGDFLPGASSGDFTIETLKKAGVVVQDLASVGGEANLRQLVTPATQRRLARMTDRNMPDYYLNGAWTSLSFDRDRSLDVQIAGIGPYMSTQRATMSTSVKLVKPGSLTIAGQGALKFSVYSNQLGVSVARLFSSTLVTGDVGGSNQDPMQLWSGEYSATLATALALASLPGVPHRCGRMLDKLVEDDVVSM